MICLICGLAWFLSVRGGLITGVVGILMMPWKLLRDFSSYIFVVPGARLAHNSHRIIPAIPFEIEIAA
jgi:hypothetical protein